MDTLTEIVGHLQQRFQLIEAGKEAEQHQLAFNKLLLEAIQEIQKRFAVQ